MALLLATSATAAMSQLSTEDHLAEPGFWPTRDEPSREGFIGTEACATCHGTKVATQKETPMAQTLMPAAAADILRAHPLLTFRVGRFEYQIQSGPRQSAYSASDGGRTLMYPLAWAFGTGRVAQSYLFRKEDGGTFESRVSYFTHLGKIDFTPARTLLSPASLEEAMYRPVPSGEMQRCFACHSTASTIAGKFDERQMTPGVTCEACHGPGAAHVRAMDNPASSKSTAMKPSIFNSAHLSPSDAVDFCGACHGTWWDVKLAGVHGASTTRSAPYRLVTSKCWGAKGDVRLTCTACHDPHRQLETATVEYDRKCVACHANSPNAKPASSQPGRACPKAGSNCTSCHMPKVNVAEMHADFTDHRIRIVKPGEAFPE